jgi:hypothetical protein
MGLPSMAMDVPSMVTGLHTKGTTPLHMGLGVWRLAFGWARAGPGDMSFRDLWTFYFLSIWETM